MWILEEEERSVPISNIGNALGINHYLGRFMFVLLYYNIVFLVFLGTYVCLCK